MFVSPNKSDFLRYLTYRKKSFSTLCNQEIVDLESVTGPDVELVKGLVQEHQQLTGSTVAEHMLEDWNSSVKMFVKVWSDCILNARAAKIKL